MLFVIKNRLVPTLILFAVFVAASFWMHNVFGLSWNLDVYPSLGRDFILGLGTIAMINIFLHSMFCLIWKSGYLSRCHQFLEYFRSQKPFHFLAGGLLAGSEEMIFRGILLEGLMNGVGMNATWAITWSALVFGVSHIIPDRRLVLFASWAVFEGFLLGGLYVITGSLLLLILVHAVNDTVGFALFALQRRTSWLLGKEKVA